MRLLGNIPSEAPSKGVAPMNRNTRLRMFGVIVGVITCHALTAWSAERPNFVFFITDDITWNDLGCYGNTFVHTPNLDHIASEGMVFDNCYLTISSCSPSRCSIITGRYPHNTGAPELHTALPDGQYLFPLTLKDAGYYTVLSGKHHMGPAADKAFTKISKGKGPGREEDWVDILRDRPKDRPFFCWFASTDAHRGWTLNDQAPQYNPQDIQVPPYLYDGPDTRSDLAQYYHEVSRTDYFAGKIVEELHRQGITENTFLIYCSDNGRPFPRCKTRLYDDGIKTPLIVWCPRRIKPARCGALVSSIDFGPTILELAGLKKDERIQGVSFAKLLDDPTTTVRDYVFAEHNWHVYQAHERMVRCGNWVYIRNAWPQRHNMCVESDPTFPAGRELWEARDRDVLSDSQRGLFQHPLPGEELFDIGRDPYQLTNLASSSEYADKLLELREVLDRWIRETGDTVPENPTNDRQDPQGRRNPNFHRGTFPGAEREATSINAPGPVTK
jgi:N-sulfoglucosamine sulfohydrolase